MECFVAAICLDAAAQQPTLDVAMLRNAIQRFASPDSVIHSWTNRWLAFACVTRTHASDVALAKETGDRLMYVDGPIAYRQSQPTYNAASFTGPYGTRLATFNNAMRRWMNGDRSIDTLTGSFSGIYHDAEHNKTLAITDQLGSRPLFVCQSADWLYLANDIRALLGLPGVALELDLEAIAQLVRYQTILDDRTLYAAIKIIAPATVLLVDHRTGTVERTSYWSLAPLPPFRTQDEAIDAAAQGFKDATERIVADSTKLALLLSGGFDSRMLLASLSDPSRFETHAFTFGPSLTDEARVAQQVAQTCDVPWHFVKQSLDAYWQYVPSGVRASNGLNAAGHMHLYQPTAVTAAQGYDTVLNGWGFDLPYSGSYFPKETFHILGRQLYTYRLNPLHNNQEVTAYLHHSLDMQDGDFTQSLFGTRLRKYWTDAPYAQLASLTERAVTVSNSPYDAIDYTLFGFGIAKFRSYSVLMNIRSQLRERNPLFESDVIEIYQRLPHQWRYLGPVFRRAVRQLNPALAAIPYSNVGVSAFAPPFVQALSLQTRTAWRANLTRIRKLGAHARLMTPACDDEKYGSYHYSSRMATYLHSNTPLGNQVQQMLVNGPLVESGLLDPHAIKSVLDRCAAGSSKSGFTVMSWVSLALWLETYPATIPTLN